jgi:hypothetical protein
MPIAEGCVGETVAAIEAAEALEQCEDATARAALEVISADEGRHAALAWQFVAWALQTGESGLRSRVREAFDALLAPAPPSSPAQPLARDRELARHGLLSAPLREALRQRARQLGVRWLLKSRPIPRRPVRTRALTLTPCDVCGAICSRNAQTGASTCSANGGTPLVR